jgi:hypothetical protein
VVFGDPALVVGLSAGGNSRTVDADGRVGILLGRDFLGAGRGTLGSVRRPSASASVREKRLDPGSINKVRGANESGEEKEVQEDTRRGLVPGGEIERWNSAHI